MADDPLSLLLVEDNFGDAILIREKLNDALDAHVTEHVSRLGDALALLEARRFDAILLDLSLPDSTGLETIRRTYAIAPDTPIVVLTGLDDAMFATAALREGARDYVVKGHANSNALGRAVYASIEQQQLMRDIEEATTNPDELRFRKLLETLEAGLVVLGPQAEVLYANPLAERLLGRRLRLLRGNPLPTDWQASGVMTESVAARWNDHPARCLLLFERGE